ncbi:MAG: flagellar M-ring protein FliF [Desulfarculales bacterium]|jgi:flagellar M-ring protein FliF|nr:flagellar M-ring protein FliF [Desulfarculales bacterium]
MADALSNTPLPAPSSPRFGNAKQAYKDMSLFRKLLIMVIAAMFGAVIWAGVMWGFKEDYQVLYSGLNQQDASQVVSKLRDLKVPYSLEANGSVISVPQSAVYETRLSMASEGLPKGQGVGFEVFNKVELGTTDFVQKINYQRALQGELARTISGFAEVMDAKVHIVMPRDSLFVEEEKKPSAGVVVNLAAGRTLSKSQIAGIVHLVASSVPDLTDERITVVDNRGNLLYRKAVDSPDFAAGLSGTQLDYQKNFEQLLKNKIESMLEDVVGQGRAVVRVAADIDFTRTTTTQMLVDPDQIAPISENTMTENSRNMGLGPAGSPDQRFTLAQRNANPNLDQGGAEQNIESGQTNYEVSRTQRHVNQALGGLKRLNVAVVVDGPYTEILNDESRLVRNFLPRSDEEMQKLTDLVRRAMGFSDERGDELTLANVPFAASLEAVLPQPPTIKDYVFDYGKPAFIVLAVLLALFLLTRPLLKFLNSRQAQAPGHGSSVLRTVGPGEALPPGAGGNMDLLESEILEEDEPPHRLSLREQILMVMQQNPERVVAVLKSWVREVNEETRGIDADRQ